MSNNENNRSKKGYYKFSKKYPSRHGSSYAIGESRKMRKKERARKVLFAVLLCCLFVAVYIGISLIIELSTRPIPTAPDNNQNITVDKLGTVRAIYIDNEDLEDITAFSKQLQEAKENGFNAVMLDFKTKDGILTYGSSLLKNTADDEYCYISDTVFRLIEDYGLMTVARVYCFEDSVAPQRIGAYVYEDVEKTKIWFDAPAVNGGKVWLDPTSEKSQLYLCAVIEEVADLGVDLIYLDSVQFPKSREGAVPVYTENDALLDRNLVLQEFIKSATKAADKCPVILGTSYEGVTSGDDELWGGNLFDTQAPVCSPLILNSDTGEYDYVQYIADVYTALNNGVKNNFSTIKVVPTVKKQADDEDFYTKLASSGTDSYIIVP